MIAPELEWERDGSAYYPSTCPTFTEEDNTTSLLVALNRETTQVCIALFIGEEDYGLEVGLTPEQARDLAEILASSSTALQSS